MPVTVANWRGTNPTEGLKSPFKVASRSTLTEPTRFVSLLNIPESTFSLETKAILGFSEARRRKAPLRRFVLVRRANVPWFIWNLATIQPLKKQCLLTGQFSLQQARVRFEKKIVRCVHVRSWLRAFVAVILVSITLPSNSHTVFTRLNEWTLKSVK